MNQDNQGSYPVHNSMMNQDHQASYPVHNSMMNQGLYHFNIHQSAKDGQNASNISELQSGSQDLATTRVLGKGHQGHQRIGHEASTGGFTPVIR